MSTKLRHGGYSWQSHFDIEQHRYGASGAHHYREVLEVRDPPDGKSSIVVNFYVSGDGYTFWEFEDIETAIRGFEMCLDDADRRRTELATRRVHCGKAPPWFYAKEPGQVEGDLAIIPSDS